MSFGEGVAAALGSLSGVVVRLGLPLAVTIWLLLLAAVVMMQRRLRSEQTAPHRRIAGAVGGLALLAHLLDFITTISVTPDLALETSPLWVAVIDRAGFQAALVYGLTGKALIVVLSYQLFAWYRIQRLRLFPKPGIQALPQFIRAFGGTHLANLGNFLSFAFPLLSPLMLYVVALNTVTSISVLSRLPSLPAVTLAWLILLPVAYFQLSHRAYLSR